MMFLRRAKAFFWNATRSLLPSVVSRWIAARGANLGPYDRLSVYSTFQAALTDSDGFSHGDIVRLVLRRTESYVLQLTVGPPIIEMGSRVLQNLFVFSHISASEPINIVELGGSLGATFFEIDHFLPRVVESWRIVELRDVAHAGRTNFENERLRFFEDTGSALEEPLDRDLFMTQGGIQCMEDPLATLASIWGLGFRFVYLTRIEVCDTLASPVIVRLLDRLSANGPGPVPADLVDRDTSYPATFFPQVLFSTLSRGLIAFASLLWKATLASE